MKHVFTIVIVLFSLSVFSQEGTRSELAKYRRSSLHMVLIESDNFPDKDVVVGAYNSMPFPDKYNDHSLNEKSFDPKKYNVTEDDRIAANGGKKPNAFGKALGNAAASSVNGAMGNSAGPLIDTLERDYPIQIEKYINETGLAKKLVAKWFNRKPDGKFDMSLIQERGFYDASQLDVQQAQGTTRGSAALGDAGEQLIKNTFVIFSKLKFIDNEIWARIIRDAAVASAQAKITDATMQKAAITAAEKVYEKTKEGYTVITSAWLYQLNWNDSIESIFYNDLYSSREAFDNSDLFSLSFVGKETSSAFVGFSLKEKRTKQQITKIATIRNFDNTLFKLQKSYEVFRPVVPVSSSNPITAAIGMKEGLKGGEKFDAMELTVNAKTGRSEYKKTGSVTVDKKKVWDNRYNLADAPPAAEEDSSVASFEKVEITHFNGSKKVGPGMVLKQVKFSK